MLEAGRIVLRMGATAFVVAVADVGLVAGALYLANRAVLARREDGHG